MSLGSLEEQRRCFHPFLLIFHPFSLALVMHSIKTWVWDVRKSWRHVYLSRAFIRHYTVSLTVHSLPTGNCREKPSPMKYRLGTSWGSHSIGVSRLKFQT